MVARSTKEFAISNTKQRTEKQRTAGRMRHGNKRTGNNFNKNEDNETKNSTNNENVQTKHHNKSNVRNTSVSQRKMVSNIEKQETFRNEEQKSAKHIIKKIPLELITRQQRTRDMNK